MHEASLINGLMRRIDELGRAEGARKITGISVWLGALSHMSPEHFTEHFEQAASGSYAEGAELKIVVSDDIGHENAQDIVLNSIEVET
jgi:hydrogenase nickel incorporation protein HypA/HybF